MPWQEGMRLVESQVIVEPDAQDIHRVIRSSPNNKTTIYR